jgi:hypothetical protein
MDEITTIGIDLAKNVFQVHAVDASGAVVIRKALRRVEVVRQPGGHDNPNAVTQERLIRDMQRQQAFAALTSQNSPATNTAAVENTAWPPKPE